MVLKTAKKNFSTNIKNHLICGVYKTLLWIIRQSYLEYHAQLTLTPLRVCFNILESNNYYPWKLT